MKNARNPNQSPRNVHHFIAGKEVSIMSLSPTFPNLYRYGFITSRAADLLSNVKPADITPQQREVFSACRDLVRKIIQGEGFLIGPNPEEVHNLRPEDVEIFTYVLDADSVAKSLAAGSEEGVRRYFQEILETFELLTAHPPKDVDERRLTSTLKFVTTIADSLIESARESLRRTQAEESSSAFHE
jgi:hypothetical protein